MISQYLQLRMIDSFLTGLSHIYFVEFVNDYGFPMEIDHSKVM